MISMIKNWKGTVEINGTEYETAQDAIKRFKRDSDEIHIILKAEQKNVSKTKIERSDDVSEYRITVKKYMTESASPSFDFMAKWNDNNPMPLRTMTGTVVKETRGMVYMNLHGEGRETITCMCCGKELTNPISRHYGIGPICMGKVGITRAVEDIESIKEDLINIKWSGWIIKSAITSKEEV